MPTIYLIRHEEPEMRGCFLGRTDPPLTPAGSRAAAKLAGLQVAALYVSPLRRARETAAAIGGPVAPVVLPELAEISFGEWEGLTWRQIEERWPDAACRKVEDWLGVAPPGGESWSDFRARVDRALTRVLAGPQPAAIVAHMVVNAALAERLLGRDPKRFRQEYGEILTCEISDPNPRI
jgi:broad specificity phosphatase PhoE